jgi:hypothetical protein
LTAAQTNYDSLLAKYNVDKANAPADTAAYDAYKKEYQARLMNTPMYMQAQFQTGNEPKSAGLQWATRPDVNVATGSGMGLKQFNKNITDFATQNPTANTAAINAQADKAGVSAQDIFNATQNRWGNTLQAPKYATPPPAVVAPPTVSSLTQINGGSNTPIAQESFDSDAYLAANQDVASELNRGVANFGDAYGHYLNYGMKEGRQAPMRKAIGGQVKTHYNDGGRLQLPSRTVRSSDAFQVMGQPQDPSQFAAADAYNDILRNRVIADTQSGRANDPMYGVADARQLETRANTPERGFGPLVAQRELASRSNEGEFAAPGYGDLGQFAGSFDPANVPMGDNRYSPVDQARMIARDTAIVDGTASIMPRDGGRAARANLMGDSDDGRYAVSGYGDLGQFAGGFGNSGGIGGKYFDDQSMATMAFAHGGQVKTHYQTAGSVQLPSGYGSAEEEADFLARQERDRAPVEISPVDMSSPPPPMISTRTEAEPVNAPLATIAMNEAPAPAPVATAAVAPKPPAAPAFGSERMGNIQALLAAYGPKDGAYGEDLKAARASAKAESDAFAKMLSSAMKSPEDEKSSKAEMYFRLASAFGAPTKTGHFAENLGMVGKELGEYSKGKRASAQQKLALALEGQKMKMTAAKEDLNTLRTLAGKEMDDKRAIATELIKDYIKSGEPQSAAGKQAKDEGLTPGTPDYQKRVEVIGNMNIEGKLAQITASLAGVSATSANLALAQEKFQNQKQQQAKLSGPEIKMKSEAEDLIASSKQSLLDLKQAYALNPNTLAGGWLEKGQQFLGEAAGSKDPTIVNTRILNNLLGSQGLAKLKATFGGAPTEGERAILMELEGIGAKTKEERGAIIKRAYRVLQDRVAREQSRLDQITSGAYRMTAPLEEGTE